MDLRRAGCRGWEEDYLTLRPWLHLKLRVQCGFPDVAFHMTRTQAMIAVELAAVGVFAAVVLGFGINSAGLASGYVDPLLRAGAQDEAVYGHAAARMVRTGHWMTPVFLDRFLLNKPPLLMWAGAASMRLWGIRPLTLRLPVLAAGVLCCVLIYWWLRRWQSLAGAIAGVVLLLGTPMFHAMNRRFMTDALLTLFVVAAMCAIAADPRWERRGTAIAFGLLSGAAILTKSAAGLLPLLILAAYWILAGRENRPPLRKVLTAFALAALVAAPWHIYEFVVHKDWFTAEYVRFQLLGSGVTAPSRYTGDTNLWFYLGTMLRTDPILLVLSLTGIPWMVIGVETRESGAGPLAGVLVPHGGPLFGSVRNARRVLLVAALAPTGSDERAVLSSAARTAGLARLRLADRVVWCENLGRRFAVGSRLSCQDGSFGFGA